MPHPCRVSRRTVVGALALTMAMPTQLAAKVAGPQGAASSRLVRYIAGSATGKVTVEVLLRGKGPLVVLLPSLGRGASDFNHLAARIAAAGYRTAAINPRGIGKSTGGEAKSLADYARDVFEVIKALHPQRGKAAITPVVLIGHAYGNRLARAVAAHYPEAISNLILLASGGQVVMAPDVARALRNVFDPALSPQAHIEAVRTAFFAPGNDPEVWRDGWYGAVAMQQEAAVKATPADDWTAGGGKPIYIIQAAQDTIAPPANAEALQAAHPERVEITILDHAGHAMLPEQPEKIAQLVLGRLASLGRADR